MSEWDFPKTNIIKFLIASFFIILITYYLNVESYAIVEAKSGLYVRMGREFEGVRA